MELVALALGWGASVRNQACVRSGGGANDDSCRPTPSTRPCLTLLTPRSRKTSRCSRSCVVVPGKLGIQWRARGRVRSCVYCVLVKMGVYCSLARASSASAQPVMQCIAHCAADWSRTDCCCFGVAGTTKVFVFIYCVWGGRRASLFKIICASPDGPALS